MHIFTYGSLMFLDIWQNIVKGQYRSELARLSGYQRVYIKNAEYPVLRSSSARSEVDGLVYFDVSNSDIKRLDTFEGLYYHRKALVIQTSSAASSAPLLAETYLLKRQFRHLASARIWSPEQFSRRDKPNFISQYCRTRG